MPGNRHDKELYANKCDAFMGQASDALCGRGSGLVVLVGPL
jgi:hypothetical protein